MLAAWSSYSLRGSSNHARPDTADSENEHLQYLGKVGQLRVHLGIPWLLLAPGAYRLLVRFSPHAIRVNHEMKWLICNLDDGSHKRYKRKRANALHSLDTF